MRAFFAGILVAAILAGGSYVTLTRFQESASDANTTGSARLGEEATWYAREPDSK